MALQGVTKPNNLYSDLARFFAVLLSIAVEHADDEGEIVVTLSFSGMASSLVTMFLSNVPSAIQLTY